ncbi:STAS domain-containing protein [Bailinhaonella thermotolerans]|uniref:STAS domain-containing protein n=1 Tax=Bailinhaonella thermotolerans TaxID=1070861 RepID=A0A3A4AQH1_9ACTN|nr:STAS domain-containing protein [Bailinhaonella thermotolerans]RJL31956.1 STAS domain-containing protein [Bailinhaonella thermotolerans]
MNPAYDDGQLRITTTLDPPGLRLHGVVHSLNSVALQRELTPGAGRRGDLTIDATRLDHIDVTGLRVLASTAHRRSSEGGRLVLAGLSPHLRQLLVLLGWDSTPGLHLNEGGADT